MGRVRSGLQSTGRELGELSTLGKVKASKGSLAALYLSGSDSERRERFEELSERITELTIDPANLLPLIEPEIEGSGDIHPELPSALGLSYMRSLGALQGALPRARQPTGIGLPGANAPLSMTAVDDFLQTAAVIEDPFFGVDLAVAGGLSPRAARALRQAYPEMHTEIVQETIEEMARIAAETPRQRRTRLRREQARASINYQMMLRMSNFAQIPLDSTQSSDFVATMQTQFAQTPGQEQAQFASRASTRRPGGIVENSMTTVDRITQ